MVRGKIHLLSFCFIFSAFTNPTLTFVRIASNYKSGGFNYTEEYVQHYIGNNVNETNILFKDERQKVFVRKRIDFSKNIFRPAYEQEDLRDGYYEGATINGNLTKLMYRKNATAELRTKDLNIPQPAIVDGGFNYFLKANWQQLCAGRTIKFYFAIPSQLDYYKFCVSKIEERHLNNKKIVVFKMEPDKVILRAIVPSTILTYDIATKRLIQYEGLSTINDKNGKSCHVKIFYPDFGP
jgi:hypothetical protein